MSIKNQSKMSLQARKELISSVKVKYKKACWKAKSKILNGFIAATSYQRKYAICLLNAPDFKDSGKQQRGRTPKYDKAVQEALLIAWRATNQICSKRLVPFLPELVRVLQRHGHLSLTDLVRERLLSISTSTVDRLLMTQRQKQGHGISTTKSGSLLKQQIKIRTFADWNDVVPGFLEGDLVAHCGGRTDGSFLNTLVLTDIASGWTEFLPLLMKSSANVIKGINIVLDLLPFPILGVDTDNGSEFINYELLNFCKEHHITFTRSRPYKKNDQAHVEEKNGSIVRRIVGYDRYEGIDAWHALADLYAVLRLYVNYFQPSLKLVSKKRDGAKVTKQYDKAQTPCQRLLSSKHISEAIKLNLKQEYEHLDPINLLNRLSDYQGKFWQHAWSAQISLAEQVQSDTSCQNQDGPAMPEDKKSDDIPLLQQQYRKTKKPRKEMQPRTWRTRTDPFAQVWNQLCLQLELDQNITAKKLLDQLILEEPEKFNPKLLRTIQRRVAAWKQQKGDEKNGIHMLKVTQGDTTSQYLSLVIPSVTDDITDDVTDSQQNEVKTC